MFNRFRLLVLIGFGVYAAVQLSQAWSEGLTGRAWLDLAATYGGLMAVWVGWMIFDRPARAKPPSDGPEADYADPPERPD